jgi:hypothetical protein
LAKVNPSQRCRRGNHERWLGDSERTAANSRDEWARAFAGLARRTRRQRKPTLTPTLLAPAPPRLSFFVGPLATAGLCACTGSGQ